MNINKIQTIPVINKAFTKTVPFRAGKIEDIFERTTKPASGSDNKAIQWLENEDYVNKRLIKDISNPQNKIGSGFSHSGFVIPGNNEYVLRVSNSEISKNQFAKYEIKDTEDKNLKINIGQSVAEITLKDKNGTKISDIEVLRRQNGYPLGVKPYSTIYNEDFSIRQGELPYEAPERKADYEKSIEAVAKMPVEAFETLLDNINEASDKGYRFDFLNSNNILIDEKNNSLNLIDMEKRGQYSKIDNASILYALTNIEYYNTYKSEFDNNPKSDDETKKAFENTMEIITKYTTAMKNKGLKFDTQIYSHEAQDLMLSPPFMCFCRAFTIDQELNNLKRMGLA